MKHSLLLNTFVILELSVNGHFANYKVRYYIDTMLVLLTPEQNRNIFSGSGPMITNERPHIRELHTSL